MARKVFMSVLGTGMYGKCKYQYGDFVSAETRFIQQATLEILQHKQEWTDKDVVYIYQTETSQKANWDIPSGKRLNRQTGQEEEYAGLCQILKDMHLQAHVCPVFIPEGKNEDEIWQVFNVILSGLEEGDELYFDLTHGFRYLPMLILVLGNYAKFLKHTKTMSITYGNFEARAKETNTAPITDLRPLLMLQEWTDAASDYLRHGDVERMKQLSKDKITPLLRVSKGKDRQALNMNGLVLSLEAFTQQLHFCRGLSLLGGKEALMIRQYVNEAKGNLISPLTPLLTHIRSTVEAYASDDVRNLMQSARLCLGYENYQSAITLLEEAIVTFFCLRQGIAPNESKQRDIVNKAFAKRSCSLAGRDYMPSAPDMEMKIDKVAKDTLMTDELVSNFSSISGFRNDFNHAGFRPKPQDVKQMKKYIEKSLTLVEELFQKKCLI